MPTDWSSNEDARMAEYRGETIYDQPRESELNIHRDNLTGCEDCLCYIANGDIPEERPTLREEIREQWGDLSGYIVNTCEETCEGRFSWSRCQICGSNLGGNRHPFAVLCSHPECRS